MSTLVQDLHYADRMLRRSPTQITAVAVICVGLGIGPYCSTVQQKQRNYVLNRGLWRSAEDS